MEVHAGGFIPAIHAAQIQVIDAAKITGKIEGISLDPPQPAGQGLQVQAVLPDIIALDHALGHSLGGIIVQQVGLPVRQEKPALAAKHQVHEPGQKAFFAANLDRRFFEIFGKVKLQLVDTIRGRHLPERPARGGQRRVQGLPHQVGDLLPAQFLEL